MTTRLFSLVTMLLLAVGANTAFGQPEQAEPKPACPAPDLSVRLIAFLLGPEGGADLAGSTIGLTAEEEQLLSTEVKTVQSKCEKALSDAKGTLADVSLDTDSKISKLELLDKDGPCAKDFKAADGKLRKELAPGKYAMLALWSRERLSMLAGREVSAAESGQAVIEAISNALSVPEGEAQKAKQSWIYYKTIELTHRKRILQGEDAGGTNQSNYIRMVRVQTDSRTRQLLPEEKRTDYNKYMGLE